MTVKLTVNEELNNASFSYSMSDVMKDQYDLYTEEVLENGKFIVSDMGEHVVKGKLVGFMDIEFHEGTKIEDNKVLMEEVKKNLETLDRCKPLYEVANYKVDN